jgi:chromosome partitioning protein
MGGVKRAQMTKVITVSNRKGGVAKTTTVITLGHGLALKGKNVLLVDVDPQGHVAPALGLEQEPGLFDLLVAGAILRNVTRQARPGLWVVPGNQRTSTAQTVMIAERAADGALLKALRGNVNGGLDYIVLDTAPSVGRLQEMALWAADLVVIPSAVDFLSSAGIADLVGGLHDLKGNGWKGRILGVLPTFFDEVTRESKTNLDELQAAFGDLVLPPIHRATILRECAAEGKTLWELAPKSRAADEYAALVWRVLDAKA